MGTHVSSLIADLERHRKSLNRVKTSQLNSSGTRNELRSLIEQYFNVVRPEILSNSEEEENVSAVDTAMQNLLELCHKRGSVKKYKDLLTAIKRGLISIDTYLVSSSTDEIRQTNRNSVDSRIIVTYFRQVLPLVVGFPHL